MVADGTIGIDSVKRSLLLHGALAGGSVAVHRKLDRANILGYLISRSQCPVALAFLLLFLATGATVQSRERLWTVTCGLPQQNNPFLELLPAGGYNGPWFGDPRSGHLEVKTLNRRHPDGGLSGEMWLLSRSVGWWRLKAIRVHPDDRSKVTFDIGENRRRQVRQIIDSPFLSRPAVIRAGVPSDEELVNGQILPSSRTLPDCGVPSDPMDQTPPASPRPNAHWRATGTIRALSTGAWARAHGLPCAPSRPSAGSPPMVGSTMPLSSGFGKTERPSPFRTT